MGRIRIGFRVHGGSLIMIRRVGRARTSEVECLCERVVGNVCYDPFAGEIHFDVTEIEIWNELAQKRLALEKLTLDFFCMTSWSERLSVAVFLLALDAGSCAGGAARMF